MWFWNVWWKWGPRKKWHIAGDIPGHIGEALHGNMGMGTGPMIGVPKEMWLKQQ